MTDEELIDAFCRFLPSQRNDVIRRAGAPRDHLPPESAPVAVQAQALLQWAEQSPVNRGELVKAVLGIHIRDRTEQHFQNLTPPYHLSRVFDREVHEACVLDAIQQQGFDTRRVPILLLPGPSDECPIDFVERCEHFTLRKIWHENGRLDVADGVSVDTWPSVRRVHQSRLGALLEETLRAVGQQQVKGDINGFQRAVAEWAARDRTYKLVHYKLFLSRIVSSDGILIKELIDFWRGVELLPACSGIAVVFSVQFRRSLIWRYVGASACCVRRVRKAFAGMADVVVMEHLKPPTRDDIDCWVDSQCRQAWGLMKPGGEAATVSGTLPLDADELRLAARAAFGWRRKRSLLYLKSGLEAAIKKSHEKFLRNRGSR